MIGDAATPLTARRPFEGDTEVADMVRGVAGSALLVSPRRAPSRQATTPSIGLADAIGRMSADAPFRQAWQADPWLALACYDLIQQPSSRALPPRRADRPEPAPSSAPLAPGAVDAPSAATAAFSPWGG
jgi:hypothetical protein